MDAVTGLSGSGPAYESWWDLMEAWQRGYLERSPPRWHCKQYGDGSDVARNRNAPAELKDRVTSPGGTTIAGVAQLEQSSFAQL